MSEQEDQSTAATDSESESADGSPDASVSSSESQLPPEEQSEPANPEPVEQSNDSVESSRDDSEPPADAEDDPEVGPGSKAESAPETESDSDSPDINEDPSTDEETPSIDTSKPADSSEKTDTASDTTPSTEESDPTDEHKRVSAEEYTFSALSTQLLPTNVQYTTEYDEHWVYSTGYKAGAGRDDVPVQGLEVGVVTHEKRIVDAIVAVLNALTTYHEETGTYPRHRIIKSRAVFNALASDSLGLIAAFQAQPDTHDGLLDHLSAFQTGDCPTEIPANIDTTKCLMEHLAAELKSENILRPKEEIDIPEPWEDSTQVGHTVLFEQYTALGSDHLYDPLLDGESLEEKVVDSPTDLSPAPKLCSVKYKDELAFLETE